MASAGLSRKKVTVHGRKGTYQRSVMVRSTSKSTDRMTAGQFLRKHGARYSAMHAGIGAAGALGGIAGMNHSIKHSGSIQGGHAAKGWLAGSAVGVVAASVHANATRGGRALLKDHRRLSWGGAQAVKGVGILSSIAGHVAGTGAAVAAHRVQVRWHKT